MPTNKICTQCNLLLVIKNFGKDKTYKDGYKSKCKYCISKNSKKYYLNNKEKYIKYSKNYYINNKNKCNNLSSLWQKQNRNIRNLQQREYIKIIKEKCIRYLGGKCSECAYSKSYKALQFHHVNPFNKLDKISNLVKTRNNWAKIKRELDKCDLLCANCHAEEHDTFLKENN